VKSKLYTLEGVVIGRRDYGEADRVVTLLTAEGRFDLLAKGIRKPRSRKAGHLELFSRAKVLVSRVQGSWDIISQAEAQVVRSRLQADFQRGTYARYVAELALRFFEDDTDEQLYTLVEDVLSRLDQEEGAALLLRWYEQQLLTLAGFRPEWGECVGEREAKQCARPLAPRPDDKRAYGVDLERGGALCPDCLTASSDAQTVRLLSPSALSWLQALQRHTYQELTQFSLPSNTTAELARVMEQVISYHLERRPSTLKLMR